MCVSYFIIVIFVTVQGERTNDTLDVSVWIRQEKLMRSSGRYLLPIINLIWFSWWMVPMHCFVFVSWTPTHNEIVIFQQIAHRAQLMFHIISRPEILWRRRQWNIWIKRKRDEKKAREIWIKFVWFNTHIIHFSLSLFFGWCDPNHQPRAHWSDNV